MIFSNLFCYPCFTASYCSIFSVHFTHHFAFCTTKFGVVLGKLTIRYSGVDGDPNDDHSESVPGCWHGTFFKTIVRLRYVNSSYTFSVNFKSVGRRTAQLLDRLPWQPEVATESFKFLIVCTTFATGDKSNLHQRGIFDTLSKTKSCLKGGERKLLIFRLGSRTINPTAAGMHSPFLMRTSSWMARLDCATRSWQPTSSCSCGRSLEAQ